MAVLTDGMLAEEQTPSQRRRSRISHAKMEEREILYAAIFRTTDSVATRGLLPPIALGWIDPVSWKRQRILETQPLETWRRREMSHGRAPPWASSTIRPRVAAGNGRPFTKRPPSWFIPERPITVQKNFHPLLGSTAMLFILFIHSIYSVPNVFA